MNGKQEAIRFIRNSLLLEAILRAARAGDFAGQADEDDTESEAA